MASAGAKRLALAIIGISVLTACEEGSGPKAFQKKTAAEDGVATFQNAEGATIIERDVESPEVFQQSESGLWDGRPSLGGVWVAHPEVADPERVIIRNDKNGKFVIGALFRRERENPGPRFQVSSDAAAALGMLAGAPANLNVTALRREEVTVAPEISAPTVDTLETPEAIQETKLAEQGTPNSDDPVAAIAASAIEEATSKTKPAAPAKVAEQAPAVAPAKPPSQAAAPAAPSQKSSLDKPYVQIGIFSVEANAKGTSDLLRAKGVIPTIKKSSSSGKEYWRVIVGPARNKSERSAVLKKVKGLGFSDAYAVTN